MDLKYYQEEQLNKYAEFILNSKHIKEYNKLTNKSDKLDYLINYENLSKFIGSISKPHICIYCNEIIPAGSCAYKHGNKYWCFSHDPNWECPNCRHQSAFKLHHVSSNGDDHYECRRCGYYKIYT